jgi:hypothetical protein
MANLMNKKAVEILSVGNWNGTEITLEDLDAMITAWEENPNYQLPLKLGHDKNQKILQNDGYPAAGWIERIYRNGHKLMADFKDIPAKIYQLIENKAYRQVSSEVFFNVNVGGKKYRKMLAGVALLGADVPGVMNLNDMLAMYGHKDIQRIVIENESELKTEIHYFTKEIAMEKTALELKLEQDLEAQKAEFTKVQEQVDAEKAAKEALEKEVSELREFKAKDEAEKTKLAAEKLEAEKKTQMVQFTSELKEAKLMSVAMQPVIEALLGDEQANYTIKIDEKNEKKFETKQALLKECLALFKAASEVNFDENSTDGDKDASKLTEDALIQKATELAAKDGVTFKAALRTLRAEKKEQA